MLVFKASKDLLAYFKAKGSRLGLVPTMGALHQGHLSLVERACEENEFVVVSIYINPTQFNQTSDLENYPTNLDKDKNLLAPFGEKIVVYAPEHYDLYPKGTRRKSYDFGSITAHMEGVFRPGHFDGVATVVEALFENIQPQKAYFGEKDFQQLQVIKALNKQKKLGVSIISCPTIREKDGLAMSSRNQLLTPEQRKAAPVIFKSLYYLKQHYHNQSVEEMELFFKGQMEQHSLHLEYFFVASVTDLTPVSKLEAHQDYRFFVAVFAGKTRLIDTLELDRI
ncbi:MAG: pantoate--beta-alanine ligase [Flavobacteriaceae bacterium]